MRLIRQKTPKIYLQLSVLLLLASVLCTAPVRGSLAYSYTYTAEIINTFTGATEEDAAPETPSESEDQTSDTGETTQPSDDTDTQEAEVITGVANPAQESTNTDDTSGTSDTKTNDTNLVWRYVICIAASAAALLIIWGRGRKHGDEETK